MWNIYDLPTTAEIDGKEYEMRTDYRVILDIFSALNDPDLMDNEKVYCALTIFYPDLCDIKDLETATKLMYLFMNGGREDEKRHSNEKPLMDWEQDLPIIIAPVNRILDKEIRALDYLHWWTFLSAFMEIGECTFNTYVGIRDKLNHGKKLEKYEEKILRDNREKIIIKKKYDSVTQDLMNEIMGRG